MRVRRQVIAILVGGLAITACGSSEGDDDAAGPTTTLTSSAPSTTAPLSFESTRHHYRLEMPAGWRVTEYDGTWTDLEQFDPGAEVAGEDVVAPASTSSFLVVNSMAIPEGTSATDWLTAFDAAVATGFTETCPGTTRTGSSRVNGRRSWSSPARARSSSGAASPMRGAGTHFTTRGPSDDRDSEAMLEDLVAVHRVRRRLTGRRSRPTLPRPCRGRPRRSGRRWPLTSERWRHAMLWAPVLIAVIMRRIASGLTPDATKRQLVAAEGDPVVECCAIDGVGDEPAGVGGRRSHYAQRLDDAGRHDAAASLTCPRCWRPRRRPPPRSRAWSRSRTEFQRRSAPGDLGSGLAGVSSRP